MSLETVKNILYRSKERKEFDKQNKAKIDAATNIEELEKVVEEVARVTEYRIASIRIQRGFFEFEKDHVIDAMKAIYKYVVNMGGDTFPDEKIIKRKVYRNFGTEVNRRMDSFKVFDKQYDLVGVIIKLAENFWKERKQKVDKIKDSFNNAGNIDQFVKVFEDNSDFLGILPEKVTEIQSFFKDAVLPEIIKEELGNTFDDKRWRAEVITLAMKRGLPNGKVFSKSLWSTIANLEAIIKKNTDGGIGFTGRSTRKTYILDNFFRISKKELNLKQPAVDLAKTEIYGAFDMGALLRKIEAYKTDMGISDEEATNLKNFLDQIYKETIDKEPSLNTNYPFDHNKWDKIKKKLKDKYENQAIIFPAKKFANGLPSETVDLVSVLARFGDGPGDTSAKLITKVLDLCGVEFQRIITQLKTVTDAEKVVLAGLPDYDSFERHITSYGKKKFLREETDSAGVVVKTEMVIFDGKKEAEKIRKIWNGEAYDFDQVTDIVGIKESFFKLIRNDSGPMAEERRTRLKTWEEAKRVKTKLEKELDQKKLIEDIRKVDSIDKLISLLIDPTFLSLEHTGIFGTKRISSKKAFSMARKIKAARDSGRLSVSLGGLGLGDHYGIETMANKLLRRQYSERNKAKLEARYKYPVLSEEDKKKIISEVKIRPNLDESFQNLYSALRRFKKIEKNRWTVGTKIIEPEELISSIEDARRYKMYDPLTVYKFGKGLADNYGIAKKVNELLLESGKRNDSQRKGIYTLLQKNSERIKVAFSALGRGNYAGLVAALDSLIPDDGKEDDTGDYKVLKNQVLQDVTSSLLKDKDGKFVDDKVPVVLSFGKMKKDINDIKILLSIPGKTFDKTRIEELLDQAIPDVCDIRKKVKLALNI